jgi:hypothetical protein
MDLSKNKTPLAAVAFGRDFGVLSAQAVNLSLSQMNAAVMSRVMLVAQDSTDEFHD